jgi:hypothetical protein
LVYKNLLIFLAFVLICFGMIELSYRIYTTGLNAFNPLRFNSMNVLVLTDLVERSVYPDIFYQLKPNLDTYFQAVEFSTNSAGMADREYLKSKPENTFRVAVVGSSWTMGTGLRQEEIYHSILESELNETSNGLNYEFLNFGVEYYGLREIIGTAWNRALKWEPDVIVIGLTMFTCQMRWVEPDPLLQLPAKTNPFFQSYSLRAFDKLTGLNLYKKGIDSRPLLSYTTKDLLARNAQLERALKEAGQLSAESGIPVIAVWLTYKNPGPIITDILTTAGEDYGLIIVEPHKLLSDPQYDQQNFKQGHFNSHPNKLGNELIAESLKKSLLANKLLPDNK